MLTEDTGPGADGVNGPADEELTQAAPSVIVAGAHADDVCLRVVGAGDVDAVGGMFRRRQRPACAAVRAICDVVLRCAVRSVPRCGEIPVATGDAYGCRRIGGGGGDCAVAVGRR